jgi:histidine triad (HIT) family protein
MNQTSIFTRIINGEIPAYKIYEDDQVIAILDIHPIFSGHTLVVPKKQIDHIWDMDDSDYQYLWQVSKKIAQHIREVINPPRVGVVVEGFGVPHCHIHLIPIYAGNDLKRPQEDKDSQPNYAELAKMAELLKP